jgi:magnesium chelatase family protein
MSTPTKTILDYGSGGLLIDIECHLSNGLPGITIVGLGNKAVEEAKERVRSAYSNSNIPMPRKRITINLAPADVPKDSTSLDLAIALSIMQTSSQISEPPPNHSAVIGELGLAGTVRAVRGIIGKLLAGKESGITRFYIPGANMDQAILVPNITLVPIKTLSELYAGLNGQSALKMYDTNSGGTIKTPLRPTDHRLSDVMGQATAKRAIEIAAAGGHNILLSGPPGMGKSMLAKALPSILPPLSRNELLQVTHLHSLVDGNYEQIIATRPFRSPHHSTSHIAVIGGGNRVKPGEISLAHRGVLFLDEFPEFSHQTVEALRQPLEDRTVTISRARESIAYPASFMLVATANPCPCGNYGTTKSCECSAHRIVQYRQRLSGPIMDRIDLYIDVEEVKHDILLNKTTDKNDEEVRLRITRAWSIQGKRYGSPEKLNSQATNDDIKTKMKIETEAEALLNQAAQRLDLSARSYMRVIKIARTIADLAESSGIMTTHIGEAIQYRKQNNIGL